jgi:hypothetical protein
LSLEYKAARIFQEIVSFAGKIVKGIKEAKALRKLDKLIANGKNNSADWANSQFPEKYGPPYTPGTKVTDFVSDGKTKFVRVVSDLKCILSL